MCVHTCACVCVQTYEPAMSARGCVRLRVDVRACVIFRHEKMFEHGNCNRAMLACMCTSACVRACPV